MPKANEGFLRAKTHCAKMLSQVLSSIILANSNFKDRVLTEFVQSSFHYHDYFLNVASSKGQSIVIYSSSYFSFPSHYTVSFIQLRLPCYKIIFVIVWYKEMTIFFFLSPQPVLYKFHTSFLNMFFHNSYCLSSRPYKIPICL